MSVRLRAIQGIVSLNHTPSGNDIAQLLKDPSGGVRVNALDVLITLKVVGAAEHILPLTQDEKWYVRRHAVHAIGEPGLKQAMPLLVRLMTDSLQDVTLPH